MMTRATGKTNRLVDELVKATRERTNALVVVLTAERERQMRALLEERGVSAERVQFIASRDHGATIWSPPCA